MSLKKGMFEFAVVSATGVDILIADCSSDSGNNPPQATVPQIILNRGSAGVDVRMTSATGGAEILFGDDIITTPIHAEKSVIAVNSIIKIPAIAG